MPMVLLANQGKRLRSFRRTMVQEFACATSQAPCVHSPRSGKWVADHGWPAGKNPDDVGEAIVHAAGVVLEPVAILGNSAVRTARRDEQVALRK